MRKDKRNEDVIEIAENTALEDGLTSNENVADAQDEEYPYIIEMCNITKEFPGIIANDNITLQERILLEKACSNSNHYRLIQELLALQKNKVLLMKKQGLQNDLEERINDFVKSASK